jgi:2-phospho-L-lactate guanylyltransferase
VVPDWTIVIPVKGTAGAKSRLGATGELALAIALDSVAAAVAASAAVSAVVVVTSPSAAGAFAELGASVVADPGGGLNAAVSVGIAAAARHGGPVAVLLGDVPALRPAELSEALMLAGGHPRSFVSDADGTGTVLITALSAADHSPRFGEGSRAAHRAAGYVELSVPAESGLRRDVDTADQLFALGERVGPRTAQALKLAR